MLNTHARQPQASRGEEEKDHNRKTARSEAKGIKKAEITGEQSSSKNLDKVGCGGLGGR